MEEQDIQKQQYEQEEAQQVSLFPNIDLSEEGQKELITVLCAFKQAAVENGQEKHEMMANIFGYFKSKFVGDRDLLPMPSAEGSDRDANKDRPRIFLPVMKQIANQIYSQLKLTLFPNDAGFMRIKGKNANSAQFEDAITDAFDYALRQAGFTEKMGLPLLNSVLFGVLSIFPKLDEQQPFQWRFDSNTMEFYLTEYEGKPEPDIEALNPVFFYPDPTMQFGDRSKWVYISKKKRQELLDDPRTMNKSKLMEFDSKTYDFNDRSKDSSTTPHIESQLNSLFDDLEAVVDYDVYYVPYVKLKEKELRNVVVTVAEDQVITGIRPNMLPMNMNPAVFTPWRPDPHSPYGDSPVEDMYELQRLINIIENYKIEVLSRSGNRFEAKEGTDFSQFYGGPGGIVYSDDGQSVRPLSGDFTEVSYLQNTIGVLKAEAQITSGANSPFQGSANIDFKKTATELQIMQEQTMTISREVTEHLAADGVKQALERLLYLMAAASYKVNVRNESEDGPEFQEVDFGLILQQGYEFYVEVTSVNPAQSRQAQVEQMSNLLELMVSNPETIGVFAKNGGYNIIRKMANYVGIRDVGEIMYTPTEVQQMQEEQRLQQMQQMQEMMAMQDQAQAQAVQQGMV